MGGQGSQGVGRASVSVIDISNNHIQNYIKEQNKNKIQE